MNSRRILPGLALLSMLTIIFGSVLAISPYLNAGNHGPGPYVDQHWREVIISDDARLTALLTHSVDIDGVPRPGDIDTLVAAGFTVTRMERIGYTFLMENNRVWPFGTPCGGNKDPEGVEDPLNAENWRAVYFRKGMNRLVDKDACVEIYAPLMGAADWWLPPGQAAWINPAYPGPSFDVFASDAMFDAGGFTDTGTTNLNYDPDWPTEGANLEIGKKMRIDPLTGEDLKELWYYALGPEESPLGFEMATEITSWMEKMGLKVNLEAGSWLGMVTKLINPIWDDYELMTGVGIIWGSTAPDILYDFVYSLNLPLWCFSVCNYTELDYWALEMMSTLNLTRCKEAAFNIQKYQDKYEPYSPLLLWNLFTAVTGPYGEKDGPYYYSNHPGSGPWEHPGFIGIVNAKGFGVGGWTRLRGHANRTTGTPGVDQLEINKFTAPSYLDSLNPMEADTAPDWVTLGDVMEGLIGLNPYTHAYEPWGATKQCVDAIVNGTNIKPWVGPGRFQAGGNEEYDGTYDVGPDGEMGTDDDTYEGKALADVTSGDLVGDDKLGMVTIWEMRDDMYWHDDDPAGTRRPVTTADILFCYEMMINQENDRYVTQWRYVWDIKTSGNTFKVFEERQFIFAFEGHGVGCYAPKHIWEPWIDPVRAPISTMKTIQNWTSWTNDEHEWYGWEEVYMEDPQYPGQMLTYLIGFGSYVYHIGGWEPGVSVHIEGNRRYLNGFRVCPADCNLDRVTDMADYWHVYHSFGTKPGDKEYDTKADVCFPAQEIGLDEVYLILQLHFGDEWGPGIEPCS